MFPNSLVFLVYFLVGAGLVLGTVIIGCRMGRQTRGIEPEPKKFNPGPTEIAEKDPYEEAMRSPEEARRIPTVEAEK